MSLPRVSVVIPSYNHELFVERALRSVLEQDYPDLELVVVDDGSTDGTRAVVERVLAEPTRCKLVYEAQANAGAHAALERAIALSSGEVIAVLNSDDYFHPQRLARLVASGQIDERQRERFATGGAVGSHLENIQRSEGFKGFNQQTVSDIIRRTDPRSAPERHKR